MDKSLPSDEHASAEELAAAVAYLSVPERIRLKKKAEYLIWGTGYSDPMELLNETVKRAMVAASGDRQSGERGRPWPMNRVPLPAFLSEAMKSIAEAKRDSIYQTSTESLEAMAGTVGDVSTVLHSAGSSHPDIVELAIELEEAEARQAAAAADVTFIEKHFEGDQAVLAIIEGEKDGMTASEVRELFELDEVTYDSARRRLRRHVDKLMPGRRVK